MAVAHYDFSGWATKNDIRCSDGRTIKRDAFIGNDGTKVPLVWNHQHGEVHNVLGHALLENRPEGVYAYGVFNETPAGRSAKAMVENGDITSLSIYANNLRQNGGDVIHGVIRELSLVLAGANPGAFIESIISHGAESDEEAFIYSGEELEHSDKKKELEDEEAETEEKEEEAQTESTEEEESSEDDEKDEEEKEEEEKKMDKKLAHADEEEKEETVQDVFDTLTDKQKNVVYALVGQAIEDAKGSEDDSEGGKEMKHNAFEAVDTQQTEYLSHADQMEIIQNAKSTSVGSLQKAIKIYEEEHGAELAHSFDNPTALFPEYKNLMPGAPELITRDMTWVDGVISGVHKNPYSRIKTRQANAKIDALKAKGYTKAEEKKYIEKINLIQRTTDPQTVYVKDKVDRDDILDTTDFDLVEYNYKVMRMTLNETLAMAMMVGDQRAALDPDKIKEDHIRPIWTDHELYTIHKDVDLAAAKASLQGSDTNKYFSENYIFAEALVEAALYAREEYKGSGSVTFYCTPRTVNKMLLARDRNGRRIYDTVTDLAAALNVSKIETAEQFAGLQRTTEIAKGDTTDGDKKELLGIFVNMKDYEVGSTKGGEITQFSQFDMDFNQEKQLLETRLSGALARVQSAIVLELPVA